MDVVCVHLVREKMLSNTTDIIHSSADAAELFQRLMGNLDREVVSVLSLDNKNRPINISVVSVGTLTASLVHPREIFKPVILSNAAAFIIAHNHPSGDVKPSEVDKSLTKRIQEAGELIGIEMVDHIIVSDRNYYSFRENGLSRSDYRENSVVNEKGGKQDTIEKRFDAAVKRCLRKHKKCQLKEDIFR